MGLPVPITVDVDTDRFCLRVCVCKHLYSVVGRRRKRNDRLVVVLVGDVDGHVRRCGHRRVTRVNGERYQMVERRLLAVQRRHRRYPTGRLVDREIRLRRRYELRGRRRGCRRLYTTSPHAITVSCLRIHAP